MLRVFHQSLSQTWRKGARRWESTVASTKFDQALDAFYLEREALLKKSMSAVLKSKRKQVEGLKPRSIESSVASLAPGKLNRNDEETRPVPVLDLSNVFNYSNTASKKNVNIKQQMRSLARGSVLSSKFLPETDDISVSIFIPPNELDQLVKPENKWRLRAFESNGESPLSISLYAQKGNMVSCATLRGKEDDLIQAYRVLVTSLENLSEMQQGKAAAMVAHYTNLKKVEDVPRTSEMLSGAFVSQESPDTLKVWGDSKQIGAVKIFLDLLNNCFLKNLAIQWKKFMIPDPNIVPGAMAHICRASFIVPAARLKIIVGKDSLLLRHIMQQSGARIKFEPVPTSEGFVFTSSGTISQVHDAVSIVSHRLEEYERYLQDIEWRDHIALRDREELTRLVGHEFINIRKIELRTGAFLRVSQPGDPVLSVRIWGSQKNVANAVKAVYALTRLDSPAII